MRESSGGQVVRPARWLSCSAGGDSIASSGVGMVGISRGRNRSRNKGITQTWDEEKTLGEIRDRLSLAEEEAVGGDEVHV